MRGTLAFIGRWVVLFCCACAGVALVPLVLAADDAYPTRPINFIVPWGTGGGADYVGRAIAKELQPILGASMPVINVPGGTGQTGLMKMGAERSDGYTVELVTSETLLLEVTGRPLFKPEDFACVGIVDQQNAGLLVKADSPFKTWDDVVRAAKAKRVSVAFDGFGSSGDLIVNHLNRKIGAKFDLVPYDKPGERIASVLGGHNELLFTQPGDVVSYVESKQLRPILMFADRRDPRFPDVATSRERGYDVSFIHFRALYVKKDTPQPIMQKLTSALGKAIATPAYRAALEREDALPDSAVAADKAPAFIRAWLQQAKAIRASK